MSRSVLVAYATRYGSTREVAEAIGARLRGSGFEVETNLAREIRSLKGYDAVVLGTPLYIGSMLNDATDFIERNRATLEFMPVAIFALGPLTDDEGMAGARLQLTSDLAKTPWLSPAVAELFVGKFDPAHLHLADKLLAALPVSPLHGVGPHDARDWAAIDEWAKSLPAALGLEDCPTS